MDRQTEITTPGALLNEKGDLARPGFSRALVQEYRRADVKVSPLRIKEWDYYLVNNGSCFRLVLLCSALVIVTLGVDNAHL